MNKSEKHKLFGMFNTNQKEEETMTQDDTQPIEPDEEEETQMEEYDIEEDELEGQLALDMYQTKDHLVIKSTIAGVRPEDIDVTVNENVLTITGERVMEEEIKDKDYVLQECYWGEFSRSVEIPTEFDVEGIGADIKDGILTVRIPKSEKVKPKKIQVKG